MLVITRNLGETIYIGDDVTIQVTQIEPEQVKLGIEAPRRIEVHREEVYRRINGDIKSKALCVNSQKGISLIEFLCTFIVIAFLVYNFGFIPYKNEEALNKMRTEFPENSPQKQEIVDAYKLKPAPRILPAGMYSAEYEYDGKNFVANYYFGEDSTITKEMVILGKYTLSGKANYRFSGSVLMFENVEGAKALFDKIGEPISVVSLNKIVLPTPENSYELIRKGVEKGI